MEIIVNGKPINISAETVYDLLIKLEIDPSEVVVVRNLEVVPKKTQQFEGLRHGDRIEIIHFVGGG
jgi:thiamine biosynthesis protein ThiS